MKRRDFLKSSIVLSGAMKMGSGPAHAAVRAHNWGNYDFGSGPQVTDRLNQGPFPQYAPDAAIPGDEVVMTTTPAEEAVANYGRGLVTYITADMGTEEIKADNVSKGIEDLVLFPLGQQLYVRPTWREVQPRPGRLEIPDYLKLVFDLAKKNNKRVGLRIQMSAPDYWHAPALPDFVLDRVPKVDLLLTNLQDKKDGQRFLDNPYSRYQPRFDDPFFQQAFRELVGLLADSPDQRVRLKRFHGQIRENHPLIRDKEPDLPLPLLDAPPDANTITENYNRIKEEVQQLVQESIARILDDPALRHLMVRRPMTNNTKPRS